MASKTGSETLGASDLFNVNGLVAFITGGGSGRSKNTSSTMTLELTRSQGIGAMLAKALAQNGAARVYIAGRRLNILQQTATSIGSNVIPVQCDVTSKKSLMSAVSLVENEVGFINLLACNSGINGPYPATSLQPDATVEEFADANFSLIMIHSWIPLP